LAPSPSDDTDVSQYVHEKTSAYRKFEGFAGNFMSLRLKHLSNWGRARQGREGDIGNEGISRNVIENKHRKITGAGISWDVFRNK
jgi:hypothetical protein